jgi:zinc protease
VLDVLETVLSRGQSSRLYSRMVDKEQLVLSVNANRQSTFDPGLLVFVMQPRSGVEPARAEKVLFEELSRLSNQPVPDQELRKAKNQLLAGHYRELSREEPICWVNMKFSTATIASSIQWNRITNP